ncbi:dephospho-CoA kinase [Actinotalea sp. K2]|uniref:dephospho-CoA kinase n=1 Tax=Actinotalea sp. K2 TaxID=2939438 RepID=UPI00201737EB|nr:dephospho-CoA kinase [Actinotalea sp. K2]MCL3862008.1 dephospho-CoA kinase [Actinotalea sp. K2]
MRRVGLTGGIAAGKSVVAARLRELGAVVVDHDLLAREVVAAGSDGLSAVVAAFGERVLGADGALDRPALAEVVFADPDARAALDGLLHPRIRAEAARQEARAVQARAAVVVHDVPLLVETGQAGDFDVVVVVEAPEAVRVERLVRGRGMEAGQARARIAAQADDSSRRAVADVVLDGSGTTAALRRQVDDLWARWEAA